MSRPNFQIKYPKGVLKLGEKTCIMGILNTTPDSFSDGGKYIDPLKALDRAYEMIDQGADIIDIGGESTRPKGPYGEGAEDISVAEECDRTLPIIQELAAKTTIPISIDTTKSEVAKQAIEAGASIVNDISALRFDPKMPDIVARYNVPVVLMHMQGTPKTMQQNPTYEDVVEDIMSFLKRQINHARNAGVSPAHIILDPGFGFGKRFEHNLQILGQLNAFHTLNCPILVGPSRKQFTGPNAEPNKRVPGTIAAISQSVLLGAHIVRVHDVWETRQATQLIDQTQLSMPPLNP